MLSVLVLLLLGAVLSPAAEDRLSGVVRSAGQPIPGATVTVEQGAHRVSTVTGEDGEYEFTGLAGGPAEVRVEMFGFQPAAQKAEGPRLDFALELKPFARAAPGRAPLAARGFQAVALNENTDAQIQEAMRGAQRQQQEGLPPDASNANEAFLVTGSLSGGLQEVRPEDLFLMRPGEFGAMRGPGAGVEGAFGQPGQAGPGAAGPGGEGGMPGMPGRPAAGGPPMMGGGGPPMMGGGGRGGMMMGGGRGGAGGARGGERLGGRPGAPGMGRPSFGNRAARGRASIRGALSFSLSNSALDARPYSLTGQTVEKPSYAQSRFNISAGGPLRIPKLIDSERTFFFFNYSGNRGRNPYNAVAILPTALERAGDFSRSAIRGPVRIYDPDGNLPFPGNVVPAGRINPAALGLLRYFPLPNQPGGVQNYQYVTSVGSGSDNIGLRVMRPLTRADRIDIGINAQLRDGKNAQLYGFRDSTEGLGTSLNAGWTRNLTSRVISRLNWNFNRNRSETAPFFAYGEDVAGALGIAGVSRDPVNFGPPNLTFTNFGDLTDASPVLRRDQTSGISETITILRSKHTLTTGMGWRRMQLNTRTDQNARGTFVFSGLNTSALDERGQPLAGTGFDFADFLLGMPQSGSVRFGSSSTYFRGSAWNAFVSDDFRVRANLTLNLGLRYEYFTPFREKYDRIANLDIAPGFTGVAVVTPGQEGPWNGRYPEGLVDPDRNNFSPRAALAWRPFGRRQMQVRAGYGIFYNGSIYNQFPQRLAAQPPFASTAAVNTSVERRLTLQNGFATAPSQTITNTFAVDRGYRAGYAQTWNLAVQQSLPYAMVVELGYLGTKGTRLDIQRTPNRAAPGSPLTAEQRRQIGNAVGFTYDSSQGNSIYHAAQARFTRRFARGISGNALYTFGKSIDNASSLGGGGAVVAQDDRDLRSERGISSFNQRHTLNLFYVLASPVGGTRGLVQPAGWTGRILKDWTFSGGITASSGTPLTARVLGNASDAAGTGAVGSGRADATGLPLYAGAGFFNLAAFALPPSGRYGNAARNIIDGPTRLAANLSVARSFRIDDRRMVELRVESRNVTNHVSYTGLGTVVNASDYGLATGAAPMRGISANLRVRF